MSAIWTKLKVSKKKEFPILFTKSDLAGMDIILAMFFFWKSQTPNVTETSMLWGPIINRPYHHLDGTTGQTPYRLTYDTLCQGS